MLKHKYAALVGLLFHFAMLPAAAQTCAPHWEAGWHLPGAVGSGVYSQIAFNDGSGLALYVGGSFSSIGDIPANNVARWNGATWQTLGDGLITPTGSLFSIVRSMCVFDSGSGPELYVAGKFRNSGAANVCAVVKWNGSSWVSLGIPYTVDTEAGGLAVFDDDGSGPLPPALYVSGYFVGVPGAPGTTRLIRWNGTSWSAPPQLPGSLIANILKVLDDGTGPALYAGGVYTGINHAVQKWNGTTWSVVSGLLDGTVEDMLFFDHDGAGSSGPTLHVAGDFMAAGAPAANHLARWDGSSWQPAGSPSSNVKSLSVVNGQLLAGGSFSTIGGVAASRVAVGDGSTWSAYPASGGFTGYCQTLRVHDLGDGPRMYLTGDCTIVGSAVAYDIARVDNAEWKPLSDGAGANNTVVAFAQYNDGSGDALYAGGAFTCVGDIAANRIARRAGGIWQSLGTGLNGNVQAMQVYDAGLGDGPQLYVVGQFTSAGGVPVSRIARWTGSQWADVGGGITMGSPTTPSMAVFDEDGPGPGRPSLFVAGELFSAGALTVNRIARWDGVSWSNVGNLRGTVQAINGLAVYNDGPGPTLFAAGGFSGSGNPIRALAKWNGSTWSPVSPAPESGSLTVLHAGPDGLYGYGGVTLNGSTSLNGPVRWNASGWTLLEPFLNTKGFGNFDDGFGQKVYTFGSSYGSGSSISRLGYWNGAAIVPTSGPLQLTGNAGISTLFVGSGEFAGLWVGGTNTFIAGGVACNIAHFIGCAPCPADIAGGDRQVNVSDLLAVITSWGPCPPSPATCVADINHDAAVNLSDLVAVITAWGACP